MGKFVQGGFCPWGIMPGGILSSGILSSGGFCPSRDFVLVPKKLLVAREDDRIQESLLGSRENG